MPKTRRRSHTPKFKREVVQYHKASGGTYAATGEHFGIHLTLVSDWVRGGRGAPAGDTRTYHPPEYKAEVLKYREDTGATCAATARHFGINQKVVQQWARGYGLKRTGRPKGNEKSLSLTVAATQRALDKVNGHAPALMAAPRTGADASGLIKEVLLRLRSLGVQIEQITAKGDSYEVSYTVKETVDI